MSDAPPPAPPRPARRWTLRPSFRQLLVLAFLLVAALLAAVSVRGLATLEQLLQKSRDGATQALALSQRVALLNEQLTTMERAGRQYLVLLDPTLRRAHDEAAKQADTQVRALAGDVGPALLWADWQRERTAITDRLADAPAAPGNGDAELAASFRALQSLATRLAERVRAVTEARNNTLQGEIEAGRRALGRQIGAAIAVALGLALALALWLARPLQRLERAIVGLGENRLDERIEIRGPADVRRIGRRLDWLRQRLAETDADKTRFLRHVSHELKTPLAALREGVALLEDGVAGPLSESQREVARILRDNTATLQRRIEDLLRFNAAAFEAQRLVRRPTDLARLVASLVDEQQLQWRARGLQVSAEGPPLQLEIDAALMSSAIGNLLSNAIRFSPEGATIKLRWWREGDAAVLTVTDAGPGIAEADRERIFEPFFRGHTQPEGQLPGTGIGLSIVAETVTAHGGRVRLLPPDAEPTGTTFRIELPHALPD